MYEVSVREKPMIFNLLAIIVILVAMGFPLQIMWQFGHLPGELLSIFTKLAPLNLAVIAFSLFSGVAYYNVSPLLLVTAPLYLVMVFWNNLVVGMHEVNTTLAVSMISWAALASFHLPLIKKKNIKIMRNPRSHWWKTEARKRISVNTMIEPIGGLSMNSKTFDLSSGGAFFAANQDNKGLNVGDQCSVKMKLGGLGILNIKAKVVRLAEKRGKYPAGFGVQFLFDEKKTQKILSRYLSGVDSFGIAAA
jgi:hypothetical protein